MSEEDNILPRYLQFMALLAIHNFCQEGIQAASFEAHHGGEYDSTNAFSAPVVTEITSIGLGHLVQLGLEIEDVAWHKAGIIKRGSLAFSAPHTAVVESVLRSRASGKDVRHESVDISLPQNAKALRPQAQRINCPLAFTLCSAFLIGEQFLSTKKGSVSKISKEV